VLFELKNKKDERDKKKEKKLFTLNYKNKK